MGTDERQYKAVMGEYFRDMLATKQAELRQAIDAINAGGAVPAIVCGLMWESFYGGVLTVRQEFSAKVRKGRFISNN